MNKALKSLILIVAFVTSATMLFSQHGTLKGFVLDKDNGEPCMFANVSIPVNGTTLGASTDANGYFSIPKIPVGTHSVTITYLGYTDLTEEFTIAKEGQLVSKNFMMVKSAGFYYQGLSYSDQAVALCRWRTRYCPVPAGASRRDIHW